MAMALMALTVAACGNRSSETSDATTDVRQCLLERLARLQGADGFAFGHHDDTAYGYDWEFLPDSSDVKALTGDYPAIISWDLGQIEQGSDEQLDGVPFAFIRDEARKHAARGGVNSFSWHLRNPLTGGDSWDASDTTVVRRCVTEGDSLNAVMAHWIAAAADFIGSLRDDEGRRIPVVFRPWHEHTGDWFWWGRTCCNTQDYVALWHMTRRIFDEKGIDNVVWAYSPDKTGGDTREEYMERYPGDEYVDVLGADIYHYGGEAGIEEFRRHVANTLGTAAAVAAERGKIAALTEAGCEAVAVHDWYTRVLFEAVRYYKIAYVSVWRNANRNRKAEHFYVPYPGHPAAADFVRFYQLPQTFFLSDLRDME